MFVQNKFKEGIIYAKSGLIYTRIKFTLTSQDEKVYESMKEIQKLLQDQDTFIKINYTQDKILDKKPDAPEVPVKDETVDSDLILPKYKFIMENMIFTDEEIYGVNLDGENREYRLIWKDEDGKEYFVPLKDFDNFEAKNPNGAFSYNSETKELQFSSISDEDTNYILRRYQNVSTSN